MQTTPRLNALMPGLRLSQAPSGTPVAAAAPSPATPTDVVITSQPAATKPGHHHPTPKDVVKGAEKVAAAGFVMSLDIRVPTTTPMMSAERREKILSTIQPGDIILETDNAYPGWQRLEMLTLHSVHTHAAMYEGNGKFLEATTPDGVQRTDLRSYLEGQMMVTIVRPKYKTPQDATAALDYCRSQLGKPYNDAFDMKDPNSQYCAELVYKALQAMPNKLDVPLRHVFGRDAVGPDSFLALVAQGNGEKVYDDGASFVKNLASHWPVDAVAIAGAVAGSHFGIIGGVTGFVGGLALAICVGNKIQTGHFGFTGMGK